MARTVMLSETSDSQDDLRGEESQPESEDEVVPTGSLRPRVAFCTLDDITREENHVRRSLLQRATKMEGTVGNVAWQGDGTPSHQAAQNDAIRDAVRQLAQRYEGPREFWTESSLPTITRDSLPSAIHSTMPTKEQLPVMNGDRLEDQHPTHPSSPTDDDEEPGSSAMPSSDSDASSNSMLHFKRFKHMKKSHMSRDSLPTILSESCDGSEFGSHAPSRQCSRMGSRMNTREMLPELDFDCPVGLKARTTTKDSLPTIGDTLEPDSNDSDSDGGTKEAPSHASPSRRGQDAMCIDNLSEQLRQAQLQISAMRNEMNALRRDNVDLSRENQRLRSLASKSESLAVLAGVANNPKSRPQAAVQGGARGSDCSEARRGSAPAGLEDFQAQAGLAASEPSEGQEGSAMSAIERWQQRRQERKERRSSAMSAGKLSYRQWLQDQHELMAVAAPPNAKGASDVESG